MTRINLIDLFRKVIKFDKSLGITINGESNDYPEIMERLRDNSVTALMASDKMFKYIIAKGFGKEQDKTLIGKVPIISIAEDIAHDIADDRGCFVHVRYNGMYEVDSFKVLTFKNCRVGKLDDKKYAGKIIYYAGDWCEKPKKQDFIVYDTFNPNKEIVKRQVELAGGIEKYKGQVWFYNMDRGKVYPLSRIHAVTEDCDSENLSGVYKNRLLRDGFFGKVILVTKPLVGKNRHLDDSIEGRLALKKEESERAEFKRTFSQFMGAKNVGNAIHMEVDFSGEDLDKAIAVKQIESKIDDKLFSYTESSTRSNILVAYNNLPEMLVKSNDTVFGQNGTALKEAKISFQENTENERSIVELIINTLYKLMPEKQNEPDFIIQKLIEVPAGTNQNATV